MARAKTPTKIIEDELKELGRKVYEEARVTSRKSQDIIRKDGSIAHRGGTLRKSINYYPKGKKLTMSQIYYGQYQDPNELAVSIKKHIPESVNVISKNLLKTIIKDFK